MGSGAAVYRRKLPRRGCGDIYSVDTGGVLVNCITFRSLACWLWVLRWVYKYVVSDGLITIRSYNVLYRFSRYCREKFDIRVTGAPVRD